jgi:hypothetical protein
MCPFQLSDRGKQLMIEVGQFVSPCKVILDRTFGRKRPEQETAEAKCRLR